MGSIVVLFLLSFIYARNSNRCRSNLRAHDDDVESGSHHNVPINMLKTSRRPGAPVKEDESFSKKNNASKKRGEKRRRRPRYLTFSKRWNTFKFKQNFSQKFRRQALSTRSIFRKRVNNLSFPWKRKGPRRVIGGPVEVGGLTVCGEVYPTKELRAAESSSCCSSCSCCSSSDEGSVADPSPKKLPPPRPPAPKLSSKKSHIISNVGNEVVRKKSGSSGYSSEEEKERKKRRKNRNKNKKRSISKKRERKQKKIKEPSSNPFDNYPVAASDRKYEDFEHDYRKNGHFFDGETYQPQYHPIKSYPIKPVQKHKKEEEEVEDKKPQTSSPKGGVKYYPIKPDKELKEEKKKKRKLRSKSSMRKRKSEFRDNTRSQSRKQRSVDLTRRRDKHRSTSPKKKRSKKRS